MKTVSLVCICLFAVSIQLAFGRPRYLAIPLEDIEFLEVNQNRQPLIRSARAVQPNQWVEQQKQDQQADATDGQDRFQRGIHGGGGGGGGDGGHHDYVDFGAHTGHHGAFGWYADFPVQKEH